jgi:FlaA1/EpsC-like NDP-sugar epimerase
MIITDLNNKGKTKFVAVRFGNVLESRGNMFALFTKQIKEKKAITITHPDMTRYLMSISEAALLVMQASATGESGEIFVLDMGKPVKVLDFAKDLIKLHGLEPDVDIPIVITGIRPGEKLYEEYLNPEEKGRPSRHERIFISEERKGLSPEALFSFLNKLELLSESGDSAEIRSVLKQMIPGYRSDVQ